MDNRIPHRLRTLGHSAAGTLRSAMLAYAGITMALIEIQLAPNPRTYSVPFRALFAILQGPWGVLLVAAGALVFSIAVSAGVQMPSNRKLGTAAFASLAGALSLTLIATVGSIVIPDPVAGGQHGFVATATVVLTMLASIGAARIFYRDVLAIVAERSLWPRESGARDPLGAAQRGTGSRSGMRAPPGQESAAAANRLAHDVIAGVGVWDTRMQPPSQWRDWLAWGQGKCGSIAAFVDVNAKLERRHVRYIAVVVCEDRVTGRTRARVASGATPCILATDIVLTLLDFVAECENHDREKGFSKSAIRLESWSHWASLVGPACDDARAWIEEN